MIAKFNVGDHVYYRAMQLRGKVVDVMAHASGQYTYMIQTKWKSPLLALESDLVFVLGLARPSNTHTEGPITHSPPDTKGTPA